MGIVYCFCHQHHIYACTDIWKALFQILTSVLPKIINVLRVALIVQTPPGHTTARVSLDISGMVLNAKV